MKKIIERMIAMLICLLTLLSAAACGGTERGTEAGSESVTGGEEQEDAGSGFVERYGDFKTAQAWLDKYVYGTDVPPVYFVIDGQGSDKLEWSKSVGEPVTVTDYPDSDMPVDRTYREIEYICESKSLKVTLTLTSYPGFPVIEYGAFLTNTSEDNSELITELDCVSAAVASAGGEYTLHYNRGGLYSEEAYRSFYQKLGAATFQIESNDGLPTDQYMPYFNIENSNGGGTIAVVNWQGEWKAGFTSDDGGVLMSAGQDNIKLQALGGERFKFPGMVLLFYKKGDWQEGQNIWRRWMVTHNVMRYTGRRDFKQNVFICSDFRGTQADLKNINDFSKVKITNKYNFVFEYDAGWYRIRNNSWFESVGDWVPGVKYGDGGIKKVSDACHEAGIDFCMWFEPERLWSVSQSAEKLGNNAIYIVNGRYTKYNVCKRSAVEGLINYGKQEAQDFVVELIDNAVKEYGIDVYRQDFNTRNDIFWTAYDRYEKQTYKIDRTGATENHACEGYINAWRRIAADNPGLIFDICAGGGRRCDLETLRFGFMHTKSDYFGPVNSAQCQNYGAYSWLIFTGTGFASPIDMYDIRSRLTLSVGLGFDGISGYKKALAEWASLQTYMYGDFYQLSHADSYSLMRLKTLALEFNDYENGAGMMIAYMRNDEMFELYARGLDPDANYRVWDKDDGSTERVMSGRELMEDGFIVINKEKSKPRAAVVLYEKTDAQITAFDRGEYLTAAGINDLGALKEPSDDIAEYAASASYSSRKVSDNGAVFLRSDRFGTGGVYSIGKGLYDGLVFTGGEKDGWTRVDPELVGFETGGKKLSLKKISGSDLDLRMFAGECNGYYLLRFENSYALGDFGSNFDLSGCKLIRMDGSYASEPLGVVSFDPKASGGVRDIRFVCYDEKNSGAVYEISQRIYSSCAKDAKTRHGMDTTWTHVDPSMYRFDIPVSCYAHDADDPALYCSVTGRCAKKEGIDLWVCEKDGKYYMWMEKAFALKDALMSDRWVFRWAEGDVLNGAAFYCVTGAMKDDAPLPEALIKF